MPAPIDPKIREEIIADYAVSNSVNAVRQKYGVSWATVRKIVGEAETQINELREEKQKKYINDAWEVVNVYLAKLMDPKTVKEAKARDCATVIMGMLERIQRQQELNQQYDLMYRNIHDGLIAAIKEEMKSTPLGKDFEDYLDGNWRKYKDKTKDVIREKIKSKPIPIIDKKDTEDVHLHNIEYWYDEIKKEIINEAYNATVDDDD